MDNLQSSAWKKKDILLVPSVAGATAAPGLLQSSCASSASDLIRKKKKEKSLPVYHVNPVAWIYRKGNFRTSETPGLTRQLNTFELLKKLPKALERERPPSSCELLLQIK